MASLEQLNKKNLFTVKFDVLKHVAISHPVSIKLLIFIKSLTLTVNNAK